MSSTFENPGAHVFKPSQADDGKTSYSKFGKPLNMDEMTASEDGHDSLSAIFIGRQKWLEDNKDVVNELHIALASLPEMQRQAVDLLCFQKLSLRKAGRVAGISHKAIDFRFQHAIKSLQQYFHNAEETTRIDKGRDQQNDKT